MAENNQAVQDTQVNSYISPKEVVTEKTTLRITGNRIFLLLILVTVIANVLQFIMVLPLSIKAALEHKPMDFMNNPLFQQLILYIPTLLGILTVILIGRKTLQQKVFTNFGKPSTDVKFLALGCLVCIGAGAFGVIFSNLIVSLFSNFGIQSGMANIKAPNELAAKIVNISYLCVIAPIIEETLFRGIILKSLRRYGNVFALVTSSILFGVFHFNLIQLIPATLMGMVFAYIAIKSESIVPSIVAHAVNNIYNVILSLVFASGTQQKMIIYWVIIAVTVSIALIIILLKRQQLKSIKNCEGSELTGKQKIGCFFFRSWSFYLLIAIFIINCVILSLSSSGLITKIQ